MNILWILATQFFLLSFLAFGGATSLLPEIHRVFVDTMHLMNNDDFINLYALSQAAPGPNVLFISLFGWHMAGGFGAAISLLAMCGPTVLISVGVEHFAGQYQKTKKYTVLRRGLAPLSVGFILATSLLLMRTNADPRLLLLTFATVVILLKWKLNPLILIIIGGILGGLHLV